MHLLIEEIRKTDALRIIVQPEVENLISRKTLKSAGFYYEPCDDAFFINISK